MIAFDTETSLISDEEPIPRMVSAAFGYDGGVDVLHHTDPATPRLVAGCLEDEQEKIAAHNAPFDMLVTAARYPDLEPLVWEAYKRGVVHDTGTCERLLDLAKGNGLRRPYNLGAVTERRLGHQLDKNDPWRKRYVELIDVPVSQWPFEALRYAADDGIWTYEDAADQVREASALADELGINPLIDAPRQARGHWALHLISVNGVLTDPEAVAEVDRKLQRELDRAHKILMREKMVRPNGQRNTKVTKMVIAREAIARGVQVNLTAKQRISLSEETIAALDLETEGDMEIDPLGDGEQMRVKMEHWHPLTVYQHYGSIMGLRARTLASLKVPIIRTRFTELMETGRTSSSNPNTQNFPRKGGFRECLVPPEGSVFVIADWKTMELVCWAEVLLTFFGEKAPTAALANALRSGADVHAELGKMIDMPGMTESPRQLAKPCNFGFPGAMGPARFRDYARKYGLRLTMEQAISLKRTWAEKWQPWDYFDYINDELEEKYDVAHTDQGIMIRQLKSDRLRNGCSFPEACNGFFQGLAADVAKDTLWRLAVEMYTRPRSELYGARQVLFGHDENVLECPRADAEKVAARLEQVMNDTLTEWCPLVGSCGVDVKIAERYGK